MKSKLCTPVTSSCAVQDNKGNHCPDKPVNFLEHNGKTIGLCERCFNNYQNGAYNNQHSKQYKTDTDYVGIY